MAKDSKAGGNGDDGPRALRSTMSQVEMKESAQRSPPLPGQNGSPEEFVQRHEGKRTISKMLIANNGIAGT